MGDVLSTTPQALLNISACVVFYTETQMPRSIFLMTSHRHCAGDEDSTSLARQRLCSYTGKNTNPTTKQKPANPKTIWLQCGMRFLQDRGVLLDPSLPSWLGLTPGSWEGAGGGCGPSRACRSSPSRPGGRPCPTPASPGSCEGKLPPGGARAARERRGEPGARDCLDGLEKSLQQRRRRAGGRCSS